MTQTVAAPAKAATTASTKPPALSSFPEWIAGVAKLAELQQRVTVLDNQIAGVEPATGRGPLTAEDMAQHLIDGTTPAVADVSAMQVRADRLYAERKIAKLAVAMQEKNLAALRGRLSKDACETLKPRQRALALEVARAAAKLAIAMKAQADLAEELRRSDFDFSSHLLPIRAGAADWHEGDESQTFHMTLRDAIDVGAIAENDPLVPLALRDRIRAERSRDQQELAKQQAITADEQEREAKRQKANSRGLKGVLQSLGAWGD